MRSRRIIRKFGRADYSTASRIATLQRAGAMAPALEAPQSIRPPRRPAPWPRRSSSRRSSWPWRPERGWRFLRRLAVLRQLFQLGFEFGLPRRDLFQPVCRSRSRASGEFFDAQRIQIDLCHAGLPFSFGYREGAQATSTAPTLSTANAGASRDASQSCNALSQFAPQSRSPMDAGQANQEKGWA